MRVKNCIGVYHQWTDNTLELYAWYAWRGLCKYGWVKLVSLSVIVSGYSILPDIHDSPVVFSFSPVLAVLHTKTGIRSVPSLFPGIFLEVTR